MNRKEVRGYKSRAREVGEMLENHRLHVDISFLQHNLLHTSVARIGRT